MADTLGPHAKRTAVELSQHVEVSTIERKDIASPMSRSQHYERSIGKSWIKCRVLLHHPGCRFDISRVERLESISAA